MNDCITITMASIPQRENGLTSVVDQLVSQCNKMYVCLNDYAHTPKCLVDNPKIEYQHFNGKQQISDHGKFFWNERITGYHFTVDDDILYPPEYVEHTISEIEHYRRKAVVGYHGTTLLLSSGKLLTRSKVSIKRLRFGDHLSANRQIYMLGTGVMAYHTDGMRYHYRWLKYGGTDEQIAIYCQQHEIPMVCLAHSEGWLIDNQPISCLQKIGGNPVMDSLAFNKIVGYTAWHFPRLYVKEDKNAAA